MDFSQGSKDSTFLEEGLPSFPAFFFEAKTLGKLGDLEEKKFGVCPPIDSDQSPALKTYPIPFFQSDIPTFFKCC